VSNYFDELKPSKRLIRDNYCKLEFKKFTLKYLGKPMMTMQREMDNSNVKQRYESATKAMCHASLATRDFGGASRGPP